MTHWPGVRRDGPRTQRASLSLKHLFKQSLILKISHFIPIVAYWCNIFITMFYLTPRLLPRPPTSTDPPPAQNYITGNVNDRTFRAGEPVELATVERKEATFSYPEGKRTPSLIARSLLRLPPSLLPRPIPRPFHHPRPRRPRVIPAGDNYVFMYVETYEELRVTKDDSWARYVKEGATVQLVLYNGLCISVDLPPAVELIITDSEPGIKVRRA